MSPLSTRYTCNLSAEDLKKAVAELNEPEDNDARLKAIDDLRTRFQEEGNGIYLIRSDDSFILRFLRNAKFDQDKAYQRLLNYHVERNNWPELCKRLNKPSMLADFMDLAPVISLGQVAYDKTFVIVARPGFGMKDESKWQAIDFVAIVILTMEKMLESEPMQIHGVTIMEDLKDLSLQMAWKFLAIEKKATELVQNAMPIRFKLLNLVNEGIIMDTLWSIASKFLSEKLKSRVRFLGQNYDKLHEQVPKNVLPPFLRGTGPDLEDHAHAWKRKLISTVGEGEDTSL